MDRANRRGRFRDVYSKPWAWFWTIFIGLASGAGAFLGTLELGVNTGWAIVAGLGALVLCGGYCASSIVAKDHPGDPENPTGTDVRRDV